MRRFVLHVEEIEEVSEAIPEVGTEVQDPHDTSTVHTLGRCGACGFPKVAWGVCLVCKHKKRVHGKLTGIAKMVVYRRNQKRAKREQIKAEKAARRASNAV